MFRRFFPAEWARTQPQPQGSEPPDAPDPAESLRQQAAQILLHTTYATLTIEAL